MKSKFFIFFPRAILRPKKHCKTAAFALLIFTFILQILFSAGTAGATEDKGALKDGIYTVEAKLLGGSGRVKIESPVKFEVKNGHILATIKWTSSFYEFMKIGDEKFLPIFQDKKADATTFEIPLKSLEKLNFVAQTSKMSKPYDIEYSIEFDESTVAEVSKEGDMPVIIFILSCIVLIAIVGILVFMKQREGGTKTLLLLLPLLALSSCGPSKEEFVYESKPDIGIPWVSSVEIKYAEGFVIDNYEQDVSLIRIEDEQYLVVPENSRVFLGEEEWKDRTNTSTDAETSIHLHVANRSRMHLIRKPKNVYLAAPSVLAFIHDIGEMENIKYSGTKTESWSLDYAINAMETGTLKYAGKYNTPDYEMLTREGCDLALFSSMITHAPETREKLEEIGIPIFIDYSSYEEHPLGRTEWIKVYGTIFNAEEAATKIFEDQCKFFDSIIEKSDKEGTSLKKVALFSFSSSGKIHARKSDDYISKMIQLAGAEYVYKDVTDATFSALSIVMEPETFFKETQRADLILYNSTISGEFQSLEEMTSVHPILADLNAVKNGDVWMTRKSFFQSSTSHGKMTLELSKILDGTAAEDDLEFFVKLR